VTKRGVLSAHHDQGPSWGNINISEEKKRNLPVTVVIAEEKLDAMEEDSEEAAVTGQIVVYWAMVSVIITVETAPEGRAEMALLSDAAGQLVTVGAQEMTVRIVVASTVSVVWDTDVLAKGPAGPLATGGLLLRAPVGAAAPPAAGKPVVWGGRGGSPVAEPFGGAPGIPDGGRAVPLVGGGGGGRPDDDGPPVPVTGEFEVSAVPEEEADEGDAAGACAPPPVALTVGKGGSPEGGPDGIPEPVGIGGIPEPDAPAPVTGELELRAEPEADSEGGGGGRDGALPVAFAVGTGGGRPEPDDEAVTYTVLTETGETSLVVRPGQSVTSGAQEVTV